LIVLFRKGRLEREMNEELGSYLEMLFEENIRRGMWPEVARYAAVRRFGRVDQAKERNREQ
jgi:macrolide transport system ATP-binding/permease protein